MSEFLNAVYYPRPQAIELNLFVLRTASLPRSIPPQALMERAAEWMLKQVQQDGI